jgi:hypothetical protein
LNDPQLSKSEQECNIPAFEISITFISTFVLAAAADPRGHACHRCKIAVI